MNYTIFFWEIMYLVISRGSVLLWLLIYSMWKHRNVTEISASRIWEGVYKKRAIYIIILMVLVLMVLNNTNEPRNAEFTAFLGSCFFV